jgi:hypothetical protein
MIDVGPGDPLGFADAFAIEDWKPNGRNIGRYVGTRSHLKRGIIEGTMLYFERDAIVATGRVNQYVGTAIAFYRQHFCLQLAHGIARSIADRKILLGLLVLPGFESGETAGRVGSMREIGASDASFGQDDGFPTPWQI